MATLRPVRWLSRTSIPAAFRRPCAIAASAHRVNMLQQLLHTSSVACPPATAAVYETLGAPDHVLRLIQMDGRDLKDGEVCVKMLAAPINPSDINRIEGTYPMRPTVPAVGGTEGVGIVVAVTPGVRNLKVDDWVIPSHPHLGTWRTHIAQEESAWCKVGQDVPMEYAATVSVNPCTALRMLDDFVDLKAGDVVVQNGATSMVGQCVIQLAQQCNIQTVNLVRDRPGVGEVKERLLSLGAEHVLTEEELGKLDKKMFLKELGAEAKLGLNCVGGSAATAVLKLLGDGGTLVTYGGMSKKPITLATGPLIFKDIRLRGFWLGKWKSKHSNEDFAEMTNMLLGLVRDGKLQYAIEKVPFGDFNSALNKAMGKQGSISKQIFAYYCNQSAPGEQVYALFEMRVAKPRLTRTDILRSESLIDDHDERKQQKIVLVLLRQQVPERC